MTPRECAIKALELIRNPENWTKNAHARAYNRVVSPTDPEATCWCGEGAIAKVAGFDPTDDNFDTDSPAYELYRDTMRLVRTHGVLHEDAYAICWVNDRQGHEEVVAVFNRALSATA